MDKDYKYILNVSDGEQQVDFQLYPAGVDLTVDFLFRELSGQFEVARREGRTKPCVNPDLVTKEG